MIDSLSLRQRPDEAPPKTVLFSKLFPLHSDIAIKTIAFVWCFHLIYAFARVLISGVPDSSTNFGQQLIVTGLSLVLTWCLYRVLILTDKGDNAASVLLLTIPPLLLAITVTYVEWNIAPNPISQATALLQVNLQATDNIKADVLLTDISGRTVTQLTGQSLTYGDNSLQLSIADLSAGLYFVQVSIGPTKIIRKWLSMP